MSREGGKGILASAGEGRERTGKKGGLARWTLKKNHLHIVEGGKKKHCEKGSAGAYFLRRERGGLGFLLSSAKRKSEPSPFVRIPQGREGNFVPSKRRGRGGPPREEEVHDHKTLQSTMEGMEIIWVHTFSKKKKRFRGVKGNYRGEKASLLRNVLNCRLGSKNSGNSSL